MEPLVSILIPAFNKEKFIAETIKSAQMQSWKRKEIIVVDDGSKDATLPIARRFEQANTKIVAQENKGACCARNNAFNLAQGDYIQWLDADDILAPDKIERQLSRRQGESESTVLLTCSWGKFYHSIKRAKLKPDALWKDMDSIEWILTKFNQNVWMNPTVWMVSRFLTEAAGPWNEALSISGDDDGEYICRIVKNCEKVIFVEEARCFYRIGNIGSLDHNRSRLALEAFMYALKLCIDCLLSIEESERTRAASIRLLENWKEKIYYEAPDMCRMLHENAKRLNGELRIGPATKRYQIIESLMGYYMSRQIKRYWNRQKELCKKGYDALIYRLERSAEDSVRVDH